MAVGRFHSVHGGVKVLRSNPRNRTTSVEKMEYSRLIMLSSFSYSIMCYVSRRDATPTLASSISLSRRLGHITDSASIWTHFSTFPRSVSTE